MKDIDKIASATFFTKSTYTRTRGHEFKLVKSKVRTDIRKYFFSQRIVDDWNKLPKSVVDSSSLETFKLKLDKYFEEVGVRNLV